MGINSNAVILMVATMRSKLLLTAAFFALSPVAAEAGIATLSGIGELSCGKYLSDISTDTGAANAYGWWVAGFVSGTNVEKSRVISTDAPAHDAWLKQYCEKNPLDPFAKAAIELNKELDKRRLK